MKHEKERANETFFYTSYLNKEYVNLIIESHFCSVTYVLPFRFIWSSSFQIRIRTVLTARKEEILSWENGKTTNDIIVRFLFVELRCADWEKKLGRVSNTTGKSSQQGEDVVHTLRLNKSFQEREREKGEKSKGRKVRLNVFHRGYNENCSTMSSEIVSINWWWRRTNTFLSIEILTKVWVSKLKRKRNNSSSSIFESNRNSSCNQSDILHEIYRISNPLSSIFLSSS